MLHTIAAIVQEPVAVFELGVLCEVFGVDRSEDGVPAFDFRVCASRGTEVMRTGTGMGLVPSHSLAGALEADLIAIPAGPVDGSFDDAVLETLREGVRRGARVLSVCSGAFTLGAAGLLDGRACATHWKYTDLLASRYPSARVDLDVLYVEDGPVITSAGTAAGIDACLHVVREELGSEIAMRIARRMVVPPHRGGGQRQYVDYDLPADALGGALQTVLAWVAEHLELDHTIPDLAERANMSERTFTRRFSDEVGITPHRWLMNQRVLRARHLLEETEVDMESIARSCGFPSGAALRRHFLREVGLSPTQYRKTFSSPVAASQAS